MKTLQISKFSIFMISIVVFAIMVFAVIVYNSPSNVTKESDRIYLYSDFNTKNAAPKYVKIQDMEPNDFGFFAYPSSYNFSDSANAYQRFLLIRLPSWLGGSENDISSYRAYSMLDLDSHCMIKYWSNDQRQRIQDPCHFESYRVIDGASYFFGIKIMSKPVDDALPQLDLGVDNEGYIYVKSPTWTADKNGLIGDGRHLSKEQILKTSKDLLQRYNQIERNNTPFPLELDTHTFLIDIVKSKDSTHLQYTSDKPETNNPSFDVTFCNCTGTVQDLYQYGSFDKNMQAWQSGNHVIYTDPYDAGPNGMHNYVFEFFENGYEIRFYSYMDFGNGMKLVLDNFFNGIKLSDMTQIEVNR